MSIGSVSPNPNHHCVRRIKFRNIEFNYPIKAIYVKTNPGEDGTGEISDILYENIKIYQPLWYAIYIGPQQQEQPDGTGPGCMIYPFKGCKTQPLVPLTNITLNNISSTGGILTPGVIRCNQTRPCSVNLRNIHYERSWWTAFNGSFITEYVDGEVDNVNIPVRFGEASERVFELFTLENVLNFVDDFLIFQSKNETSIKAWEGLFGIAIWAIGMALNDMKY